MDKMVIFLNKYVIDKTSDGKIKTSVYQYDDLSKAEAAFYKAVGTHMDDESCTYAMVRLINSEGGEHYCKVFKRTVEQTESVAE